MTFMIASPCAVVLATMPPLLSAIAVAGRHGVLVKSAVVMERLAGADLVAFDKTGTLTTGTVHLVELHTTAGHRLDGNAVLRLCAAAEAGSEHPIGRAIVTAARERGLTVLTARAFRSAAGHGVIAAVGPHQVQVGRPALLDDAPAATTHQVTTLRRMVDSAQDSGHTVVVAVVDAAPAGVLVLADQVRPAAATIVTALTTVTGTSPALLTGDNPGAAGRLAAEIGITDVHAGLLPQDKVDQVRHAQQAGQRVLFVGVAMGYHGADLALTSADVLVRDDLTAVAPLIALSRRARRIVTANLVIAGTFITVLVIWDVFGHLPLPLGVAGHEGSTVIVGLNGLRLLADAGWRRAGDSPA
jgi:P-type E1-E2 ATPase